MAPIESSQRALSIGVIGFASIHVLDQKWIDDDFATSNQPMQKGRQIKSNQVILKKASNQIKSRNRKRASNHIKRSKHPFICNQITI